MGSESTAIASGKGCATKSDECSEKFQRGGVGSFSILIFILQILDLYKGLFSAIFRREKLQYDFPKIWGGRWSKAIWNFSDNSCDLVPPHFPNAWPKMPSYANLMRFSQVFRYLNANFLPFHAPFCANFV